jgi:oxaloacetate decarboxylase beta subunit
MDSFIELFNQSGFAHLGWGNWVMFLVAGILVFLAITQEYEPLLLIPISFGIVLANLPLADLGSYEEGIIGLIYEGGIKTELLPPIIFLGVGVLTDFRPLLGRPMTFLLGAAAQLGIFVAAIGAAYLFGFSFKEAAAIGIIGGADGPTSIFLSSQLAPHLLGPIALAAYSYMSLVPIIQPPILRMLTTKNEREIDMPQAKSVSKTAVILFPICAGVGGRRINKITIFLGITVGATMAAENFLRFETLSILALGAVAFAFSTAGGILFAKILNLFLKKENKINPCIGAAGVSAVPMAARVVQKFVSDQTDGRVNPLMPAMGPNVAGVIGSAVAAGVFLTLLS